jgi:hypothetical protein
MTLFYSAVGSNQLSNEEIDSWADYCQRTDAGVFDEVVNSQPGPAPTKWSVLPPSTTRSMPWDWLSEPQQESEVLRYAMDGGRED